MSDKYILYVEDNPSDVALVERIFKNELKDYQLKHFGTGELLLEWFASMELTYNLPRLILLDNKLTGMSGLEVLKDIRRNARIKNIPTVIISSSVEDKDIQKAYQNGANSYLEKPKNYLSLKNTMQTIVNYWLQFNKTYHDRE
ncbi:response regulator [Aquimarina intermedia]|uniref:Two-component system response regulator n=1 Tax=Aquimarina intermedia TaxID=350814 RepID=A0A5S5CH56_9FLAO|nr:response regulator [Aquimarina intermedia]TYP77353.1 two-component system response regulator [Aquimarina intermedia]